MLSLFLVVPLVDICPFASSCSRLVRSIYAAFVAIRPICQFVGGSQPLLTRPRRSFVRSDNFARFDVCSRSTRAVTLRSQFRQEAPPRRDAVVPFV
jgi:hypothetical protein